MNVDELDALFNKRSGMMGMTGFGDLREVHRLVAEGTRTPSWLSTSTCTASSATSATTPLRWAA